MESIVKKIFPSIMADKYDYCQEGVVLELLPLNKCKVRISGEDKILPYTEGITINKNDIVMIMKYNYNTNKKWVVGKRPNW